MTDPLTGRNALLKGSCFCGSVTYVIFAPPVLSAYCHCTNCQRLNACPCVHTIHFEESDFEWTHNEPHSELLDFYNNPLKPYKRRIRCKRCGVGVTSHNSNTRRVSVWAAGLERDSEGTILNWDVAKPTAHIFYGTHVLAANDELGKWEGYEGKSNRLG
ncbi:Mss4-like protein [Hygrophoropsis aurantiaca]|uniref:Mss4-like protein n=1 Tax=Hygrophoropsis aurantiaca TaxID=72124 RepID=A0ACB8AQA4_9AGAM|nr:Mss4-like protein [Hygrophoropsis aurantiaca]